MLAERYINTLYRHPAFPDGAPCLRYWIEERGILVGGSIIDTIDAQHLAADFRVSHVLSVESERDDIGRLDPFVAAARFATEDNGMAFPSELILSCIGFYHAYKVSEGTHYRQGNIYVHCQAGGSRSPAITYALLRSDGMSSKDALSAVKNARWRAGAEPNWGEHPFHQNYIAAIERCFT